MNDFSNMLPMDFYLSNEIFEAEFQRLTKQGLNPKILKSIRKYKSKKIIMSWRNYMAH